MTAVAVSGATDAWVEYARDPVLFIRDAFGADPDPWQVEMLTALAHGECVAVRSGHGVGKTCGLAWCVLWGLLVMGAVIPSTAPTQDSLEIHLWPEIKRWLKRAPELDAELEITSRKVSLRRDPTFFARARVARTPEGLAGFHAKQILYVIDEASGVPEDLMQVVEGALTTEGAIAVLAGNPTKPTGYFVDAFGKNSDRWHGITVNAEESPRVTKSSLLNWETTWGRDSDVYRVRVLGLPPMGEEKGFIPHGMVAGAQLRYDTTAPDGPLVLGVDVARYGADRSAIVAKRGYKVIDVRTRHGLSNPEVTSWAAQTAQDLADPGETPTIRVDDGGVGGGVTDLLNLMLQEKTLDANVEGLNFGGKGDRYYGTNAGVWWGFLRRLMQEQLLALPPDDELRQQLTTRMFATNLAGKIVLEQKEHMRDRGVPSPDKADALALAFAGESLENWDDAYGIRTCDRCQHKFIDPDGERACPQCGARP